MTKEEFLNKYEPDTKFIRYAQEGDMVMNYHGEFGVISDLSSDPRVYVGGHMQISVTGENGLDTLEINGFELYKLK
jgi:hypothetical protein